MKRFGLSAILAILIFTHASLADERIIDEELCAKTVAAAIAEFFAKGGKVEKDDDNESYRMNKAVFEMYKDHFKELVRQWNDDVARLDHATVKNIVERNKNRDALNEHLYQYLKRKFGDKRLENTVQYTDVSIPGKKFKYTLYVKRVRRLYRILPDINPDLRPFISYDIHVWDFSGRQKSETLNFGLGCLGYHHCHRLHWDTDDLIKFAKTGKRPSLTLEELEENNLYCPRNMGVSMNGIEISDQTIKPELESKRFRGPKADKPQSSRAI